MKAIEIDPGNLDARFYLVMLYANMGESGKADGQLREILAIDPNNEMALKLLKDIHSSHAIKFSNPALSG